MSIFNKVPISKPKKSKFDLSHEVKLSMQMGDLVPILCEPVMPGDSFQMNSEIFTRLAPMAAPIMHRVNVYTHSFFVPSRLIWDDSEEFHTGGTDGLSAPVHPYRVISAAVTHNYFHPGSLADYLGVSTTPDGSTPFVQDVRVNTLPFRAYNKIWNEYFRNQDLQDPVDLDTGSGSDTTTASDLFGVKRRNWEKDYFTSALPWTQRGAEVTMPANIVLSGSSDPAKLVSASAQSPLANSAGIQTDSEGNIKSDTGGFEAQIDPNGSLEMESTINELRRAVRLQEFLEILARTGSRYTEYLLGIFGVKTKDSRLQRPEYLGGGRSPVTISEVLQTSSTDTTTPQGNMSGHGISVGSHGFGKKYFDEHGYVLTLLSVMPKTAYQQGTRRHFMYNDRFDYPIPKFAQIGEQPIWNYELYYDGSKSYENLEDPDEIFGYGPRYSEAKFVPSSVHGDFKNSLDHWHMGRVFESAPALNSSFVKADPSHRVFAVTSSSVAKLYVQIYNNVKAIRPLPYFGVPSF